MLEPLKIKKKTNEYILHHSITSLEQTHNNLVQHFLLLPYIHVKNELKEGCLYEQGSSRASHETKQGFLVSIRVRQHTLTQKPHPCIQINNMFYNILCTASCTTFDVQSTLLSFFRLQFMVHIVIYNQWSSFFIIIIFCIQFSFCNSFKHENEQIFNGKCIWSPYLSSFHRALTHILGQYKV